MNTWDRLKETRNKIAELKKIRSQLDPASGASISIRRGVPHDNEDVQNDDIKRPWVTCELSDLKLVNAVIDAVLMGMADSEALWFKLTQEDIATAQAIIGELPKSK